MSQITAGDLNKAIAEVLSKGFFMTNAAPEAIGIENTFPGQLLKYHARMSSSYKILPSHEKVDQFYRQTNKQSEGAKYLLLGALEIVGDRIRISGRIIDVETAAILRIGIGNSNASYEGLCTAFKEVLKGLHIGYIR